MGTHSDRDLTGIKHDADKNRLELVPPELIFQVGRVMTHGADKYGDHNWAGGMTWSRLLGAALRHILAFVGGENNDPESNLSHLAHAATNLGFLLAYETNNWGQDDRRGRGVGEAASVAGPKEARAQAAVGVAPDRSTWSIYLAGPFHRQTEIAAIAEQIRRLGITVASTWHDSDDIALLDLPPIQREDRSRVWAERDLAEIALASELVLFTEGHQPLTGGKDVEFGYALALGSEITLVGPPVNIFHYLPGISYVADSADLLADIHSRYDEEFGSYNKLD